MLRLRPSLSLVLIVASLLLFSGCPAVNTPVPAIEQLFPSETAAAAAKPDANQPVNIYLDGTLSMRGFARPADGKFGQLLQEIDLSLSSLGSRDRVGYHRFGSIIEDIPQHPFYVAASQGNFFQGTAQYATTRIDTVFRKSPANGLTVVLSDLFEQNLDIASVQEALKSAGFPEKVSLGIWQWHLPFDGQIYDFALKADSSGLSYAGLRPLYMLALGPEDFLRKWQVAMTRTLSVGAADFLLLGRNLATNPYTWFAVTQTQHTALLRTSPNNAGIPYAEYRVPSGCTSIEIDGQQRLTPAPHTAVPDFKSHPSSYRADLFSVAFNGTKPSARALSQAEVRESLPGKLSVVVPCSALPNHGLCLLRLQRTGEPDDLSFPPWIIAANVNATQFSSLTRQHAPNWGNKTINLLPLVRELAVAAVNGAPIGTSYFYLSKT